jgi:hypothetical protein
MRACRARTTRLRRLLFPFSMLGHAPVTARVPRCENVAAFAGEHRNPPRLEESRGSRGGPNPFSQKSSRFVAREIFQSECCRLCKIAQIGIASGR